MKKFTLYFKTLVLFGLLVMANTGSAQTPCNASFAYTINPNGYVNFSSTSTATSGTTAYNWYIYNLNINQGPSFMSGSNPSYTFSLNSTYQVVLTLVNSAPTCSATTIQTIVITNVPPPPPTCTLNANFIVNQGANGSVTFNNQSTGTAPGATYFWNFGDNSTGTAVSPVHTYSADGVYMATLTVNNNFTNTCTSTKTKTVLVCSYAPLTASFSCTFNSGGNVTFTSSSIGTTPATIYNWTFDYSATTPSVANGVNLTQTSANYSVNGYYLVYLQVINPVVSTCWAGSMQSILISTAANPPCNLVANFNAIVGANGLLNFYSTSTGTTVGTTYSWSFGDGGTSTSAYPAHTYTANGVYTVTLVANNNFNPACISTKVLTFTVTPCTLNAGFSSSNLNSNTLFFGYTTTGAVGPVSNAWNFGDGSTLTVAGGGTGLYHAYNAIGTYTVILTVTNTSLTGCVSTTSAVVTVTCGAANAAFSLTPSGTPLFWNVIPASPGNVASAVWYWGDGSTSNTLYTSHTYSAAGTYSICLSVTLSCGSTNMYCNSYAIFRSSGANQDQDVIQVNVIDPATVGIKNYGNNVADFSVSPNPNNGSFNLNMTGLNRDVNILVYDLTGKVIYEQAAQSNNGNLIKEINLESVPTGIYFLKASSNGNTFGKKIIIEK